MEESIYEYFAVAARERPRLVLLDGALCGFVRAGIYEVGDGSAFESGGALDEAPLFGMNTGLDALNFSCIGADVSWRQVAYCDHTMIVRQFAVHRKGNRILCGKTSS